MSQPFFVRPPTRSERAQIRKLRKRPPNIEVHRRVQAVHLSSQRLKVHRIAEIVGRSRVTITRWLHQFDICGLGALWPDKSPGRPPKADVEFQAALVDAVERNPRDLGYSFTRWTVDLLAEHLHRTIHIAVSSSTVRNALKRLGYRYGRPKLDLKHRQDPAEVARAERQKARALKKPEPVQVVWRFSTVTKRSSTSTPASAAAGLRVVGG
ncbi:MAG: helix-turn-helix domain-containing protein [Planctomycetes bacterium]|nr:helix-turn-helix domain-containing protein [Planctomycetota bacterium]